MIYRLVSDLDKDPNHAYGEPITILRRALEHAERTCRDVAVHVYGHDDHATFWRELVAQRYRHTHDADRHPFDRLTVVLHGRHTAQGLAAFTQIGTRDPSPQRDDARTA